MDDDYLPLWLDMVIILLKMNKMCNIANGKLSNIPYCYIFSTMLYCKSTILSIFTYIWKV